jgi:hypothetical protein
LRFGCREYFFQKRSWRGRRRGWMGAGKIGEEFVDRSRCIQPWNGVRSLSRSWGRGGRLWFFVRLLVVLLDFV